MKQIGVVLLLVAGCATNPLQVLESGARFTGDIKGTPAEAASCVAKHAEYTGDYLTTARHNGGAHELIVRSSAAAYFTLAVWRFHPREDGSAYEVWISDAYKPSREALAAKMRGAC